MYFSKLQNVFVNALSEKKTMVPLSRSLGGRTTAVKTFSWKSESEALKLFVKLKLEEKVNVKYVPEILPSQFWNPCFCLQSQTFLRPLLGRPGLVEAVKIVATGHWYMHIYTHISSDRFWVRLSNKSYIVIEFGGNVQDEKNINSELNVVKGK